MNQRNRGWLALAPVVLMTGAGQGAAKELGVDRVAIHVYNFATVPPSTVSAAVKDAARILREAGVETTWIDCPITSAEMERIPACRESRLTNLTVRIIPEAAGSLSQHVLGLALPDAGGTIHAMVFYERAQRMAAANSASESLILGHAIAHEIGHLLLGQEKHAATGLMKAPWKEMDLQLAKVGMLGFSKQQAGAMCQEVRRRLRTGTGTPVAAQ